MKYYGYILAGKDYKRRKKAMDDYIMSVPIYSVLANMFEYDNELIDLFEDNQPLPEEFIELVEDDRRLKEFNLRAGFVDIDEL